MSQKAAQQNTRPSLIARGLTKDETETLYQSAKAKPGTPIALIVCQYGYREFPIDAAFAVTVRAPLEWNHVALATIIATVLRAANEFDDAHTKMPPDGFGDRFQPYCRLHFGRHIEREGGREVTVDRDVPFLTFRTAKAWYSVALPVFPAQAVADLIPHPAI